MITTATAAFSETEKVISKTAHLAHLALLTWRLGASEQSAVSLTASTEVWQQQSGPQTKKSVVLHGQSVASKNYLEESQSSALLINQN